MSEIQSNDETYSYGSCNLSTIHLQNCKQPCGLTIGVMTDGHFYQLYLRSVVGIGVAKGEVKGAEDHYAWSTVNIVVEWDRLLWLRGLEGDASIGIRGLGATVRMHLALALASTVETVMATTMARTDVALMM